MASGMPCKPEWISLLKDELSEETQWQVIAIGREDATWPTLRRAAELGGHVRTGKRISFVVLQWCCVAVVKGKDSVVVE